LSVNRLENTFTQFSTWVQGERAKFEAVLLTRGRSRPPSVQGSWVRRRESCVSQALSRFSGLSIFLLSLFANRFEANEKSPRAEARPPLAGSCGYLDFQALPIPVDNTCTLEHIATDCKPLFWPPHGQGAGIRRSGFRSQRNVSDTVPRSVAGYPSSLCVTPRILCRIFLSSIFLSYHVWLRICGA
jgi:hypothetical protein